MSSVGNANNTKLHHLTQSDFVCPTIKLINPTDLDFRMPTMIMINY